MIYSNKLIDNEQTLEAKNLSIFFDIEPIYDILEEHGNCLTTIGYHNNVAIGKMIENNKR